MPCYVWSFFWSLAQSTVIDSAPEGLKVNLFKLKLLITEHSCLILNPFNSREKVEIWLEPKVMYYGILQNQTLSSVKINSK